MPVSLSVIKTLNMICKKVVLKKRFGGIPKLTDFEILDKEVTEDLKENEFLYETLYVSVDPYTRYFMDWYKVGDTITGYQLARVTKSRSTKYPTGTVLTIEGGWTTGGKSKGDDVFYVSNDIPENVTQSAALGLIGKPGLTAYYGLLEVCKPTAGETVFISAAAGSVGNIAGQIGKMKSCRVVGSCGSDEKIEFLKSTVGFDDAFNYKSASSFDEEIKRVAPEGIDCYFDNVGGDLSTAVIRQMKRRGRICVCGSISSYNSDGNVKADIVQPSMLQKCLKMEGISIFAVMDKYDEWLDSLRIWTKEGKLKSYEEVAVGFDLLPETFVGMMTGKNVGKALVKV